VVQPTDAALAVPQAGGDARAERGHDGQVFVVHEVLARQHLDDVGREMRVEEEERGLAGLARGGLELREARSGACGHGRQRGR
jgi:hypothetical protein